jgi:N-methylhydantoinase B
MLVNEAGSDSAAVNDAPRIDGVRLAVVMSRMDSIVRNMMNTVLRSSRSGVLNSARDFSCGIVSADDACIASGESLPIHVMSGPELLSASLRRNQPTMRRGDAFLHNNPYDGNSHAADHVTLVPVFDDAGQHRYTVFVKAHQADCGNSLATTYMASATDIYNEGALIFPCVKVQEDYQDVEDIIRMCEIRLRVPEQWRGDFNAALGAARIGERRLSELAAEIGWDELDALAAQWLDYSEQRFVEAVKGMSGGTVRATTRHDPFPGLPEGIDLNVDVHVDAEHGFVEVDLTDNPDCLPCGLNLTESTARSAAMLGVFNSIDHRVPPNAGAFRRIRVILRENCVVGIPRHPASCSMATTNIADRLANAVQRAIAELGQGQGRAEVGSVIPACCAVIAGVDPRRNGEPFVNQIFLGFGGGGASADADGWFTAAHVGNSGMVAIDSVEMTEARFPLIVKSRTVRKDSEGAGALRGAPGARVEFGARGTTVSVIFGNDGYETPAEGVRGGEAGGLAREWLRTVDGSLAPLDPCAPVTLNDGESIISETPGGGGYGPPSMRLQSAIAKDLEQGWISPDRAREVYGYALAPETQTI